MSDTPDDRPPAVRSWDKDKGHSGAARAQGQAHQGDTGSQRPERHSASNFDKAEP